VVLDILQLKKAYVKIFLIPAELCSPYPIAMAVLKEG
jgi:hypothetical protein